jgi:aromatic-L-amino-acid/L-tryptophan decarboxylase
VKNRIEQQLSKLEPLSKSLETSLEQRNRVNAFAFDYAERFYNSIKDKNAYQAFDSTVNELLKIPLAEEGAGAENVVSFIEEKIITPGLNSASGRNFGYIPGSALPYAAIGDYLAAVTNRYASVYSSSPGAVLLEAQLINWMAGLVGYASGYGGYLASGGSIANLTAVVAARDYAGIKGADYPRVVVYLTSQTHHCVDRALNISGLGECIRRYIPIDSGFRMIPEKLNRQITRDADNGLIPWMIVASAGSTDIGAVDPLDEIGSVAQSKKLWFHVDAAYGGFFLLTKEGKKKLAGIEMSDSVVLDPHKSLFLPYGTGALLVKDVGTLTSSHAYHANYMKHAAADTGVCSPADISPELTKHFRALRMWLPLKLHGIKAFRSALEEKLLLADYLWHEFRQMEDIEVSSPPQLSIFMFRWVPKGGDPGLMNRKLHNALLQDGRVFLSTTEVNGIFYFRVAVLSVATHLEEAEILLKTVKETIAELSIGPAQHSE